MSIVYDMPEDELSFKSDINDFRHHDSAGHGPNGPNSCMKSIGSHGSPILLPFKHHPTD
jgi:hypothetical protein